MATVDEIKKALEVAADALSIAADWNLPAVQVNPPPEWVLSGGGEDPDNGWCSTMALSETMLRRANAVSIDCS
jgi:hypothetical protein